MPFADDATFLKVIPLVLNSEAGYVNHPSDPGGPTMRGIAWNYNADYLKRAFGFKTSADIKRLTADQAKQVYYDKYWRPSGGEGITDVDLAYIHFDMAVNCGVGAARNTLSKLSLNPKNYDGSGGKNRSLFLQLFLEYTAHRLSYYTHCRNRDAFLEGWVNRMVDVIKNAKDLD
jgi:lysozyme family protein